MILNRIPSIFSGWSLENNFLLHFKRISVTHKEFNWFDDWIGMFCVEMSGKSRWLHSFISQNSSTNDTLRLCQVVVWNQILSSSHVLASVCRLLCAGIFSFLLYILEIALKPWDGSDTFCCVTNTFNTRFLNTKIKQSSFSLIHYLKKTLWSESASELYRPSDRRLSAKSLPTFAYKGCHMVSVTNPYGRILGFLDRSRYFSIK
jgi:hypothetical protein